MLNELYKSSKFDLKNYYGFDENEPDDYFNASNLTENLNGIKSFTKHLSFGIKFFLWS